MHWTTPIRPLYREYLRQVRVLPSEYLRQFFRNKAADDVRLALRPKEEGRRKERLKRIAKDISLLKSATGGSVRAFDTMLNIAYARKGKLRWELLQPLLVHPTAPLPPRIIPSVERSRPPVYSPELIALIESKSARKNTIRASSLERPPTLPERVDPSSEEARLLGPLSKRREVNARWRYFINASRKTRIPLEVVVKRWGSFEQTSLPSVRQAGIRGLPLQGYGLIDDIVTLAGGPPPRRQDTSVNTESAQPAKALSRRPSRWIRRRYQNLLGQIPILSFMPSEKVKNYVPGTYSASLSPMSTEMREKNPWHLPEVPPEDWAWYTPCTSRTITEGMNVTKNKDMKALFETKLAE